MKKLLIVLAFIIGPYAAMAERDTTKGEQKDYEAEVRCPNGDVIMVNAKCCEPGSVFLCGFISCSNFIPPAVNCNPE